MRQRRFNLHHIPATSMMNIQYPVLEFDTLTDLCRLIFPAVNSELRYNQMQLRNCTQSGVRVAVKTPQAGLHCSRLICAG